MGVGLVFLVAGGEFPVRGASSLAAIFRFRSLVIGLTVVAFGTSAPELAVSVQAAYAGSGDLAVGNLVGSNIANVLLILGLAALVAPITIDRVFAQGFARRRNFVRLKLETHTDQQRSQKTEPRLLQEILGGELLRFTHFTNSKLFSLHHTLRASRLTG